MKIGDTIKIESGTSDPLTDSFGRDTFTIVGTVNTPYYLSYEKGNEQRSAPAAVDSYVFVPKSDFAMEVYTDVYLTAQGAKLPQQLQPSLLRVFGTAQRNADDAGQ